MDDETMMVMMAEARLSSALKLQQTKARNFIRNNTFEEAVELHLWYNNLLNFSPASNHPNWISNPFPLNAE